MSFYLNADQAFAVGLEIEQNGQRFYELAAARTQVAAVKELCQELAAWEHGHVKLFEALRTKLPPGAREGAAFDPDSEEAAYVKAMADNHVFLQDHSVDDLVAECHTSQDLLDLAISFEKDSVLFYTALKPMVAPEHGRDRVEALVREEMGHIAMLTARKKQVPM